MSEENTPDEVESTEETFNPEEVTAAEDGESVETPEEKPTKTFTQEEVDAMIGKRLAIEKRKLERKISKETSNTEEDLLGDVEPSQFKSKAELDEYVNQRLAEKEKEAVELEQKEELEELKDQFFEKGVNKYDDFDSVAHNPNLPITDAMANTMLESELGHDIAYYLGSNIEEAKRISKLSPFRQAKEIGKIELKLETESVDLSKKVSKTPPPVNPGGAKKNGVKTYDTTDPRSAKSMSTAEWIKQERARQERRYRGG